MQVLILGGTGRTGRRAIVGLRAAGHTLRALHRREVADVETIVAGLGDGAAMAEALSGVDAVVSALASGNRDPVCSTAARTILSVSRPAALRYVSVAGAAVDVPGDAKGVPDRIAGGIMRLVAGGMLADRQRELEILSRSDLRWTLLRPPRLADGPETGRVAWTFDRPASTRITRSDVAACIVAALGREDMDGRAPFVAETRT